MSRVGVPQTHDIVTAMASHTRHLLDRVGDDVVHYYKPAAQSLIEEKGGVDALARALACVAGNGSLVHRSLLKYVTTGLFFFSDQKQLFNRDVG